MSQPQLLQDRWYEGMKKDMSRDQLPKNSAWEIIDMLPDVFDCPLGKRGGWGHYGNSLDSIKAGFTLPKRVFFAGFPDIAAPLGTLNPQVLVWDDNGELINVTSSTYVSATTVPLGNPSFFRSLVIWGDGAGTPKKYDGSTVSALGGTPPTTPRISTVWKERIIFSGRLTTANEAASIYFSGAGNVDSWDTTNAVVQTPAQIQGLATLPNALLVFHRGSVSKILGDTPPAATNIGNLSIQPLFDNVGLYEPTAYTVLNESAYWADENGVYKTDGNTLVDLTDKGGIRTYWQEQVASANSISVGAWRGYVWVALHNSDTYVDFLVCDIEKRAWVRFQNIVAENFSARNDATDDLYFANRQTKYVGKLSTVFTKANQTKNDADGDPVEPELHTAFYRTTKQRKRVRRIYLGYDLRESTIASPTLDGSYITSPEATSYASLQGTSPFVKTTAEDRKRQALARAPHGFALKFAQSGGSTSTRIYSLEAEMTASEGSR